MNKETIVTLAHFLINILLIKSDYQSFNPTVYRGRNSTPLNIIRHLDIRWNISVNSHGLSTMILTLLRRIKDNYFY